MAHSAAVRRLCWTHLDSTEHEKDSKTAAQPCLASCGDDHMVRIFEVHLVQTVHWDSKLDGLVKTQLGVLLTS